MTYILSEPRLWNRLDNPGLGFMNLFSDDIARLESKNPGSLPPLHRGSIIFVGSDYSGQHRFAHYEALSFLFADLERCDAWEHQRQRIRHLFLPDGRRLSFKNLGDRRRQRALAPFLRAADSIPGLLVTILVDKDIESLFRTEGRLQMNSPDLSAYSHWDGATFERLLRTVHFVSLFVACLSRPGQDLLWISDEDAIMADEQRMRELVGIFARVAGHYLRHDLRNIRIGSTKSDTGKRDIEDLVAVPDLAAGALCRLLTEYRGRGFSPAHGLILAAPQAVPTKVRFLVDWFSDGCQSLKRLVYLIEEQKGSAELILKHLEFVRGRLPDR